MYIQMEFKTELNKKQVEEAISEILWRISHKALELAVDYCPATFGHLKGSLHIYPIKKGELTYWLADGVDYGIHVEYGTSPHMPPVKPLELWAKRKLGEEGLGWAIAYHIKKYGTPAQPFLRPAAMLAVNVFGPGIASKVIDESGQS